MKNKIGKFDRVLHNKMPLLALPSEILQQILSETMSHENFAQLRLVHSHVSDTIRASADYLTRRLVQAHGVSDHVFSLQQRIYRSTEAAKGDEQKVFFLLKLHKNIATCVELERVLDTHREKFAAFPIWADVPAKGFGSIESVLVFSAFQRELKRSVDALDDTKLPTTVARAGPRNDHFVWLNLDRDFMDFIRVQLTVDDLQALMTIVNFCAISTRFVDTILASRYYFNDAGASDHWQSEQLGSALLAERILWGGPSWLARMLNRNVDNGAQAVIAQPGIAFGADDGHTIWTGSQAEAVRLTANGVARFLWKERAHKLERELEQKAAETSSIEIKIVRPDLKVDAAVWRGSSGGF